MHSVQLLCCGVVGISCLCTCLCYCLLLGTHLGSAPSSQWILVVENYWWEIHIAYNLSEHQTLSTWYIHIIWFKLVHVCICLFCRANWERVDRIRDASRATCHILLVRYLQYNTLWKQNGAYSQRTKQRRYLPSTRIHAYWTLIIFCRLKAFRVIDERKFVTERNVD